MSRKTTSMRGQVVDFDLFAIKEQINGAPVTETIQNREKFIDLRRRRGTKRKLQDLLAEQEKAARAESSNVAEVSSENEDEKPVRKIKKREE